MKLYNENYTQEQAAYDQLDKAVAAAKNARNHARDVLRGQDHATPEHVVVSAREGLERQSKVLIAAVDKLQRILDLPRPM